MTAPEAKVYIIGVGSDGLAGLTSRARALLSSADLILGSDHALNLMPEVTAERYPIGPDPQEAVRLLEANLGRQRLVIVASGDPLF